MAVHATIPVSELMRWVIRYLLPNFVARLQYSYSRTWWEMTKAAFFPAQSVSKFTFRFYFFFSKPECSTIFSITARSISLIEDIGFSSLKIVSKPSLCWFSVRKKHYNLDRLSCCGWEEIIQLEFCARFHKKSVESYWRQGCQDLRMCRIFHLQHLCCDIWNAQVIHL